jgi:acetyltransferase-like isoleucine patch superfamily enzyme
MVVNPKGISVRQLRLDKMRARYPDVKCARCGYHVQNLIRHFRESHPSNLSEVYDLCSANEDPPIIELNKRVLQERAEVHRTCKWDPNTSVVYFVQAGLAGRPVKIGYAQEMCRRIGNLQLGCPEPMEVYWRSEGGGILKGSCTNGLLT